MKAQYWAYRDRKTRKRNFRNLWILRINAACRQLGTTYSRFIEGLAAAQIEIDRRMLAELAVNDSVAFNAIVDKAVRALDQKKAA
jgi:large subunit ribosomal protein L20